MTTMLKWLIVVLAGIGVGSAGQRLAGVWHGELNGQPAVTLALAATEKKITGTVVFYLIRDDGDGPSVAGKSEVPLLNVRFDGKTLWFEVKNRDAETVSFEMKLLAGDEAELTRTTTEPATVKMARRK